MDVRMRRMKHSSAGAAVTAVYKHKQNTRKKKNWMGRVSGARNIERRESTRVTDYLDESTV